MTFEPQKLFIGLIDFFSVLLPGAVLAYLIKDSAVPLLFDQPAGQIVSTEAWMIFLFVSYLAGHIAFLFGAALDDWLYDPLKKRTYLGQIDRLAAGKHLGWALIRRLAGWTFGRDQDAALMQALRIKARALAPLSADKAINAFHWCRCYLSKQHPEGLVSVQRFEADSKFFRSFVVVLAVLLPVYAYQRRWGLAAVCFALLLPVISRYVDQRFKATKQAYWLVLTLEAMKTSAAIAPPKRAPGEPTHAGGAVFCLGDDAVPTFLLIRSTDRAHWVLPKGRIEAGEDARQAAVREVKEETGHWARVVEWIHDVRLGGGADAPLVRFFLMELVAAEEKWPLEDRERTWLALDEAQGRVSFDESRRVLAAAEARRVEPATRVEDRSTASRGDARRHPDHQANNAR